MIGKHIGGIAATIVVALICSSCLHAQQSSATEYQIKAAYLYNFGKFVEWPSKVNAAGDSFNICVLGEDPFGSTLDRTIAGESINGKKAVARRLAKAQDALRCQIVFISLTEEGRLKEILATLEKASVLTVSDIPEFTRRGGMIQFLMQSNKVRFEINLTPAERDGLTVSSQLLKVAANVTRSPESGD